MNREADIISLNKAGFPEQYLRSLSGLQDRIRTVILDLVENFETH